MIMIVPKNRTDESVVYVYKYAVLTKFLVKNSYLNSEN